MNGEIWKGNQGGSGNALKGCLLGPWFCGGGSWKFRKLLINLLAPLVAALNPFTAKNTRREIQTSLIFNQIRHNYTETTNISP